MVYYWYTFNRGNGLSSSDVNWTCYFFTNYSYCDWDCKESIRIVSSDWWVVNYSHKLA